MMGGKTPETRWAVNKRQDNKMENYCIWLVIYLNCTMMHGLTKLKNENQSRDWIDAAGSAPDYGHRCLPMFTATYHRNEAIRGQISARFMIYFLSYSRGQDHVVLREYTAIDWLIRGWTQQSRRGCRLWRPRQNAFYPVDTGCSYLWIFFSMVGWPCILV